MCKNCLLVLTAVAVVLGADVLLPVQANQPPSPAPVTLRYSPSTNSSTQQTEPTFWVTNHSAKALGLMLRAIEIQTKGAWVPYSQIPLPGHLFFQMSQGKKGQRPGLLAPHAAGFCRLLNQQLILPTNAVWRVSGIAVETMEGADAIVWTVDHAQRLLEARGAGNTNIPINPFTTNYTRLGRPSAFVSEAVVPH